MKFVADVVSLPQPTRSCCHVGNFYEWKTLRFPIPSAPMANAKPRRQRPLQTVCTPYEVYHRTHLNSDTQVPVV